MQAELLERNCLPNQGILHRLLLLKTIRGTSRDRSLVEHSPEYFSKYSKTKSVKIIHGNRTAR